jgi:hypothetical protein
MFEWSIHMSVRRFNSCNTLRQEKNLHLQQSNTCCRLRSMELIEWGILFSRLHIMGDL